MRVLSGGLLAVLLLAGCGAPGAVVGPDGDDPAGAAVPAAASGPAAASAPGAVPGPGTAPAPVSGTLPVVLDAACTGPEGVRVAHPADWSVNDGTVVPACTRFAPSPFTVRPASDVRTAAVVLSVEAAPLAESAIAWLGEQARVPVEVDGRPGVRVEILTGPGLWPERTAVTRWLVDLGPGAAGPRTLVADTVHPPATDPEEAAAEVAVLDAMVAALDLDPATGALA